MDKDKDKTDNKISNLVMVAQMIDAAEKSITSAKQLLREMMGGPVTKANLAAFSEKAQTHAPDGCPKAGRK